MGENKHYLGEFEELLLLAIMRLRDGAYGVSIRQTIEEATERPISIGAIYTTLDRLEKKGFVSSRQGDPTPERGGRAKRYFKIEGAGIQAVNDVQRVRQLISSSVPSVEGAT